MGTMTAPDQLFDRFAAHAPGRVVAGLGLFGLGLIAWILPSGAILARQGVLAAVLFAVAYFGFGVVDALFRRAGRAGHRPVGILLPPFAFAIADPLRALAAMFLMFGLAVWAMAGRAHLGWLILLTTLGYVAATILPSYFSPLAYLIGVIAFVLAGVGVARR